MAKDEDVRVGKKYKKTVRVDITKEEVAAKDKKVRVLENRIAKKQEEMAPAAKAIREMRAEIKQLSADAESETEERDVYVQDQFVFSKNEVRTVLFDGGKLVEKRAMTAAEREEEIDFPEEEAPN